MFSKSCEYGIKAVIFIANNSLLNRKVGFVDIAKEIDSPEAFTAKILQKLSKEGIIQSVRGVNGGFYIPIKLINKINLAQVVYSIDGEKVFNSCGLGMKRCNEIHPCPLHQKFKTIRNDLRQMLETTSLEELAMGLKSGETFLKNI